MKPEDGRYFIHWLTVMLDDVIAYKGMATVY